jgi:hypothetical protein
MSDGLRLQSKLSMKPNSFFRWGYETNPYFYELCPVRIVDVTVRINFCRISSLSNVALERSLYPNTIFGHSKGNPARLIQQLLINQGFTFRI